MGAADFLSDLMAPFIGTGQGPEGAKFAEFAALRKPENAAQSEHPCGFSQNSQDSQGCPANSHHPSPAVPPPAAWTAEQIAKFLARRDRLVRWGWPEPEADEVAERLTRRDRDASDDRVSCVECARYRPTQHRCTDHRRAGLASAEVGRALAALPQRCPVHAPASVS